MRRYRLPLLMALAMLQPAGALFAAEPVGYVKTLSGVARIASPGQPERPAQVGSALSLGDTLHTGADGALGLTLKDDTRMSIGPDTTLTLDEFVFEPARGELKQSAKLGKGTLQFVSGQIARLRPDAVSVGTPTGTIGVRGTHFALKVAP